VWIAKTCEGHERGAQDRLHRERPAPDHENGDRSKRERDAQLAGEIGRCPDDRARPKRSGRVALDAVRIQPKAQQHETEVENVAHECVIEMHEERIRKQGYGRQHSGGPWDVEPSQHPAQSERTHRAENER
jgi:hypothetical protein